MISCGFAPFRNKKDIIMPLFFQLTRLGPLPTANTPFVGGSSRLQGQEGSRLQGKRAGCGFLSALKRSYFQLARLAPHLIPLVQPGAAAAGSRGRRAGPSPDTAGPARGGSSRLQGQEGGSGLLVRLEAVILPVGKAGPLTSCLLVSTAVHLDLLHACNVSVSYLFFYLKLI
jgi:hypothetical protein